MSKTFTVLCLAALAFTAAPAYACKWAGGTFKVGANNNTLLLQVNANCSEARVGPTTQPNKYSAYPIVVKDGDRQFTDSRGTIVVMDGNARALRFYFDGRTQHISARKIK